MAASEAARTSHVPVLLAEVLALLQPKPGGRYVDCTVGAGGHAAAVLAASSPDGRLLGLDADATALELARVLLRPFGGRFILEQCNYRELADAVTAGRIRPVDGVLFDLGVSSMQLNRPERGFSFQAEGPLDMRLDPSAGTTAAELVNTLSERELADIIFTYGEDRGARRVAHDIVRRRARQPFQSTIDLAAVVRASLGAGSMGGPARSRIHPATRTFQALRIAVNDELRGLEEALPAAVDALRPGGRVAVIAFHSLEDRIVKRFFQAQARDCRCPPALPVCQCSAQATLRIVTKKPVVPSSREEAANPRSRSAKLRVAEKRGGE